MTGKAAPIADRVASIAPFRVMAILAEAKRLEAAGRAIVHMEIGEPDFASPEPVLAAGRAALDSGLTHYTPAAGLPALREAIAAYYAQRFGVEVPSQRILVTPGASGALQLACAVLLNPDDEVLIPDPSYPCNRHIAALFGARVRGLPVEQSTGFCIEPTQLAAALSPKVKLLMLASPSNPTGATVSLAELAGLIQVLRRIPDSLLLCDEIYQGLQYDGEPQTALALGADDLIVINSFSKYFGMTGWRVGWMVAPEVLVEPLERLAQNLFLAAPTPSQHAALAALSIETREVIEHRREAFQARRDFLHGALTELGFATGPKPPGAFYIYADVSRHAEDALSFSERLLSEAGVAVTPGVDFGCHAAHRHVRFAYTTSLPQLELGIERLYTWLRAGAG